MDILTPSQRSARMALVRSKGNKTTELRLIRLMRARKISGWRRGSKLPGRPDFVFPRELVAVFVDGDFWHGNPNTYSAPVANDRFWLTKVTNNRRRDRRVNRVLRARGWSVIRIWESSLRQRSWREVERLARCLKRRAVLRFSQ
jgi:DNA mismatch endonuclease, patch repair protein